MLRFDIFFDAYCIGTRIIGNGIAGGTSSNASLKWAGPEDFWSKEDWLGLMGNELGGAYEIRPMQGSNREREGSMSPSSGA